MKKLLREPLFHFALIGLVTFAGFSHLNPRSADSAQRIVVDDNRIANLSARFESSWGRMPTDDELTALIDHYVMEEAYYRQALALGFDQDDPVIRRRLLQKMQLLTNSVAAAREPQPGELARYLAAHPERYRTPGHFSFEQIHIGSDLSTQELNARIDAVSYRLEAALPITSDSPLLPRQFSQATDFEITRHFGPQFSEQLAGLPLNEWQGPLTSGVGVHFVRLNHYQPGDLPPLDEVQEAVLRDWRYDNERQADARVERALLEDYEVIIASSARNPES